MDSLSPMESSESASTAAQKSFLEAVPNDEPFFRVPIVPGPRPLQPARRLNFEDSLLPLPVPTQKETIKVYLRVKRRDETGSASSPVSIESATQVALTAPKGSITYKNAINNDDKSKLVHRFAFTHVFGPQADQQQVFDTMVLPSVADFISGQNQLVFTYGATSSGKTYSIQGLPNEPGIVPRTLDVLFNSIEGNLMDTFELKPNCFNRVVQMKEMDVKAMEEAKRDVLRLGIELQLKENNYNDSEASSKMSGVSLLSQPDFDVTNMSEESLVHIFPALLNRKQEKQRVELAHTNIMYAVWISFVEIYNEDIFDLLKRVPEQKARPLRTRRERLKLAEDRDGSIYVKDLTEIKVNSANEAYQLMMIGRKNLKVAATRLNHNSSRSHCIFNIKVIHMPKKEKPHLARVSMFTFCDLAGSERQNKTNNTGDRQKESGNINTSLLVLGRCIKAIRHNQEVKDVKRQQIIPFRDSKLTRMFQSFFKGHGKASMMVNVSQETNLFDEAIQVLKFAAIASKVQVTKKIDDKSEENKAKKRRQTRFSVLVTKQHNKANDFLSGRAQINWEEPNARSTILNTNNDEDENESLMSQSATMFFETPRVDEQYENLSRLVDELREELAAERQEKSELESKLRKELCAEFNEMMMKVDNTWEQHLKSQKAEAEELSEWRIGKLHEALDAAKRELREEKKKHKMKQASLSDDTLAFSHQEVKFEIEEKNMEIRCLTEKTAALTNETNRLKGELNEVNIKLSKAEAKNEEMLRVQKEFDGIQSLLMASSNEDECENNDLKTKVGTYMKQVSANEETIAYLRRLLNDATKDFLQQEQDIEKLEQEKRNLETKVSEQEVTINDLESELKELMTGSRAKIEELEEEKSKLEEQVDKLQQETCNKENKDANLSSPEKHSSSSELLSQAFLERELNDEIESLKASNKKLREELEVKGKDVDALSDELRTKDEEVSRLEKEVKKVIQADGESKTAAESTIKRLRKEVQDEKKASSELKSKMSLLEQHVSSLQREDMAFKTIKEELEKRCNENSELAGKLESLSAELQGKEYELNRIKEEKQSLMKHYENVAQKQKTDFSMAKNECLRLRERMANMTPKKDSFGDETSLQASKSKAAELQQENEMLRNELSTKTELIKTLETVVKDQNEDEQKTLSNAEELQALINENSSLKSDMTKQQSAYDALLKKYKEANIKLQNEIRQQTGTKDQDTENENTVRKAATEGKRRTTTRIGSRQQKRPLEEQERDKDGESNGISNQSTSSTSIISTSKAKRAKGANKRSIATEVSFADTTAATDDDHEDEEADNEDSKASFRLRHRKHKVSRSKPVKTRRQPPRAAALKSTPYPSKREQTTDDDANEDDDNNDDETDDENEDNAPSKSSLKTPALRQKWYTPRKGEMAELTPVSTEERSVDVHATVSKQLQKPQRKKKK